MTIFAMPIMSSGWPRRSTAMTAPSSAFGDVVEIIDGVPRPLALRFANGALSPAARLRSAALHPLHHLYGLWRREPLRRIRWRHNEWWHDTPPMMAATMLGEFVHVPGVVFRYRYNRHPFFDWPRRPGFSGLLFAAAQFGRRLADLSRLVWNSAVTVGEVAGFGYGLLAGWFALRKVCGQICGYITRHGLSFRHSGLAARRGPVTVETPATTASARAAFAYGRIEKQRCRGLFGAGCRRW